MHSDQDAAVYTGRMSDGRTAKSVPVELRFTDSGLQLKAADTADPFTWPYASLATAEPLRRDSTDTLLSSSELPGATVFVEGAAFARELREKATQLTTGSFRWRYLKPGLVVTAVVLAAVAAVWLFDLTPARTIAGWLPEATRVRMGQQVIVAMSENRQTCHTDDGRAALDKMTDRLSAVSGAKQKFNVVVLDWDLLNAFAAPGSQIVLTRELIKTANSGDEVAGVLAHEMGHGIELHPETALVRAIGMSAALELMSGGSSGTLANMGALLAQLSYTRAGEREADAHALRILRDANVGTKGFADFFRRVAKMEGEDLDETKDGKGTKKDGDDKKKSGEQEAVKEKDSYGRYVNMDLIRTHPHSRDRLKLIETVATYDSTPILTDGEWTALRDMCKNAKKKKDDAAGK